MIIFKYFYDVKGGNVVSDFSNVSNIPIGLGYALSQNIDAMNYFTKLTAEQQQQIINHTHTIQSKDEMQTFVQSLVYNKI